MTVRHTVQRRAGDQRHGFTLGELASFLADCHTAGLPGDAKLDVSLGWRGQLQKLTASGDSDGRDDVEVLHSRS